MNRTPNVLARYSFLIETTPKLSPQNQVLAGQFRSFSENELGLYDQAVFSFPLKNLLPSNISLPDPSEWRAENALNIITQLAANRHIVMINEAHHDAHTRLLTLALLPRLRELGFTYFAAEALTDTDNELMQRGYPTTKSGTEYLNEPIYGEIIREAIKLGYTVVPYDSTARNPQSRENEQAKNLYHRVFAKDPNARIFIHSGYAHIDKKIGRLSTVKPMGMQLKKLTGLDPLCIDQTDFRESGLDESDAYHSLVKLFPSKNPFVLINRQSDEPWSARPRLYDLNVILPQALQIQAFGTNRLYRNQLDPINQHAAKDTFLSLRVNTDQMTRPKWLALDGLRQAVAINTDLCKTHLPCVVSAQYINEPDSAIAADRYAFMNANNSSKLYLRPGRYKLHAWGVRGKTVYEQTIRVKPIQP